MWSIFSTKNTNNRMSTEYKMNMRIKREEEEYEENLRESRYRYYIPSDPIPIQDKKKEKTLFEILYEENHKNKNKK